MSIDMPDFTDAPSMEDVFGDTQEDPESNVTPLPIEELSIDPSDLVIPTFVETTYAAPQEDTESLDTHDTTPTESTPPKRRGRPRGSKNKTSQVELNNPAIQLTSSLRRKTDQELSRRAQGILVGASKIPSVINPHIEMTEAEAQAIADPLVSYAKNHVDSERIEQFVEQWDLIAVGVASAAYAMRVVKETSDDKRARGNIRQLPRQGVPVNNNVYPEPVPVRQQNDSNSRNDSNAVENYAPSEPTIGDL